MTETKKKKIYLDEVSAFSKNPAKVYPVGNLEIAVFFHEEKFWAIDNMCPHAGAPLVAGNVENYEVTCPWHYWRFDIRNGQCLTNPYDKIESYSLEIENQKLYLWMDAT